MNKFTLISGPSLVGSAEPVWFGPYSPDNFTNSDETIAVNQYQDSSTSAGSENLELQEFDQSGNLLSSSIIAANFPVEYTGNGFDYRQIANNEYLVVWGQAISSKPNETTGEIIGEVVDSSGNIIQAPSVLVNNVQNLDDVLANAKATFGQGYIVTYSTFNNDTGQENINYLQYSLQGQQTGSGSLYSAIENDGSYHGYHIETLSPATSSAPTFLLNTISTADATYGYLQYQLLNNNIQPAGQLQTVMPTVPTNAADFYIDGERLGRLNSTTSTPYNLLAAYSLEYTLNSVQFYVLDLHLINTVSGAEKTVTVNVNSPTTVGFAADPNDGGFILTYTSGSSKVIQQYDSQGNATSAPYVLPYVSNKYTFLAESNGNLLVTFKVASSSGKQIESELIGLSPLANTPVLTLTSVSANGVPTISGPAGVGDTVTLYDGTTSIGSVKADATTGAFNFTKLAALSAGEHILTATATDTSGNVSAASSPLTIEVGTAATILGELNALEAKPNLSAIVLTDTHVFNVASVAAMNTLITTDAAALATIQGDYGFAITTPGTTTSNTFNYDSTGHLTSTVVTHFTNGIIASVYTVRSDGSTTLDTYNASGILIRDDTTYADHTRDVYTYGITGQSYTTEHDTYNAAGQLTSQIRTHADGSLASTYKVGTDGSITQDTYDATGNLLRNDVTHADHTREVDTYGVTGQSYTSKKDIYNAAGALTSEVRTHANGTYDFTFTLNPDGSSQSQTYDASGTLAWTDTRQINGSQQENIVEAGQTLTSNKGVADTFTDSSPGANTFVFNPAFGQDSITNFHAGSGANHDVIQIGSATLNQFSDLVGLMTASGAGGTDTLITIDPTDTILLKHVAKASLTAQNFAFTHVA